MRLRLLALTFLVTATLAAEDTEPVSFTCAVRACSDTEPESPFDEASCADFVMNTMLIESLERGDSSAADLLRRRYATTVTYGERHRIAGALLGRVPDDREYWNELQAHAADAIRFSYVDSEPAPEFLEWCAARALDPEEYHWVTLRAFELAAADPRARAMVLEATESRDRTLVEAAIAAILLRREESALPAIEKALGRFPHDAGDMVMAMAWLRWDAADRVAMKFLSEDRVAEYREQQRRAACETTADCEP
jgi:hypothetical protein